jgi:hypothetical protein
MDPLRDAAKKATGCPKGFAERPDLRACDRAHLRVSMLHRRLSEARLEKFRRPRICGVYMSPRSVRARTHALKATATRGLVPVLGVDSASGNVTPPKPWTRDVALVLALLAWSAVTPTSAGQHRQPVDRALRPAVPSPASRAAVTQVARQDPHSHKRKKHSNESSRAVADSGVLGRPAGTWLSSAVI